MRDFEDVLARLSKSAFRRRFALRPPERAYIARHGLPVVLEHARSFVERRLAPADPPADGKQTPFRGHPVFVAQHATATCCRNCLAKWHGIPRGRPLAAAEQSYVLAVIAHWLRRETGDGGEPSEPRLL